VSIFVNPTQFAPNEDFDKYPRTFDDDLARVEAAGGHLVWAPPVSEMYRDGAATRVVPKGAALGLETDFRPHFFEGVATVCCKLFTQVGPDIAVFGEKDFQQLAVVRQMVRDLDLPLEIVGHPTVRETNGLAMSSRNRYLSPEQRQRAVTIHRVIEAVAAAARSGDPAAAIEAGTAALTAAGFGKIDYIAVRDAETLGPYDRSTGRPGRVLAAAWLGATRLIDNVAV
jgi:pantoate--beta-alanine ligase